MNLSDYSPEGLESLHDIVDSYFTTPTKKDLNANFIKDWLNDVYEEHLDRQKVFNLIDFYFELDKVERVSINPCSPEILDIFVTEFDTTVEYSIDLNEDVEITNITNQYVCFKCPLSLIKL